MTNFNEDKVITIWGVLFYGWISLEELDITNFKAGNVISMYSILSEYESLKENNLMMFNTNKITFIYYRFCIIKFKCLLFKKISLILLICLEDATHLYNYSDFLILVLMTPKRLYFQSFLFIDRIEYFYFYYYRYFNRFLRSLKINM